MSYVAYNKETTLYLSRHPQTKTDKTTFSSAGSAKAAITREAKRCVIKAEDFAVAETMEFHNNIEKTFTVTSHGNGSVPTAPYELPMNTPHSCDPRYETYWCM